MKESEFECVQNCAFLIFKLVLYKKVLTGSALFWTLWPLLDSMGIARHQSSSHIHWNLHVHSLFEWVATPACIKRHITLPGILFLLNNRCLTMSTICLPTERVVSPWMELLLVEPCECPSCPSLIASKDPHNYCFKCLRPYHAADSIKKSRPCSKCRALPMVRWQQGWDHFSLSQVELVCTVSVPLALRGRKKI